MNSQGSRRRAGVELPGQTRPSASYRFGRGELATWEGVVERRAGEVTAVTQPVRLPAFTETVFFSWLKERLRDG